jgi:CRP/FNR family transcriptional regulator
MVNPAHIVDLLAFYPILRDLPPGLQHGLIDSGIPVVAETERVLFDTDETIQSFLMMVEGSIRVTRPVSDREFLLYRVHPGECCIVSTCHLLGDTRLRVRAQVETPVSGVALPQAFFLRLVNQSPPFNVFLFRSFADRLVGLLDLFEATTTQQLDVRLAGLLLSKGNVIRTTHSQLADELGTVREVISRILKDFEVRGLVDLERGHIHILNEEELRKLAGFRDSGH